MKPESSAVLVTGAISGLIGSAVVAVLFILINLVRGLPALGTAAAMGSALFAIPDTDLVPAAIAYNGLHVVLAVAAGIGASFLMMEAESRPAAWYAAFFAYLVALIVGFVLVGLLAVEVAGATSWFMVTAVNVLAALSMAWYLWKAHPRLKQTLRRVPD
ncbi:MAG: hypothetical protein PVH00_13930 [Gemmatimonadota bacterium]|jgi:hypothetical protein